MNTNIEIDVSDNSPFILLTSKIITRGKWAQDVAKFSAQFAASHLQNWLLYEDDFYWFSVYFFALLNAEKHIILAPNGQPAKLAELEQYYDIAVLSSPVDNINCWTPSSLDIELNGTVNINIAERQKLSFFTSGSSGSPKKIEKYWYQLSNEASCHLSKWQDELSNGTLVASVSHQHIYGLLFKLLLPAFSGMPVFADAIQFPEQINRIAGEQKSLVLISSPAFLTRVAQSNEDISLIAGATAIFSSGGPLPADTAKAIYINLQHSPIEIFGSTETGGVAWRQFNSMYSWTCLPKVFYQIQPSGQLAIQSKFLATTAWYCCDDLAEADGENSFILKGRIDRIVKLEEKRLSLTEVENVLAQHPTCRKVKALILEGKRKKLAVVIAVSESNLAMNHASLAKELRAYLADYFEPILLPKKWRFVAEIPVNSESKTPYSLLAQLFGRQS